MSEWIDLLDSANHTYDNTTSGLTALTTKAAVDEIVTGAWINGTTLTYWGLTSQTPAYSATITIDLDSGQQVVYTMTGDSTITLSSTMTNLQATFVLDTGGFTPTWAAAMNVSEPEGGHNWTASTNDIYLVNVVKQGSNWYIVETPMTTPA